jgi:LytR cell envelope-related transcriptional attenuator
LRVKRGWLVLGAAAVVAFILDAFQHRRTAAPHAETPAALALPHKVRVEVINAGKVGGAARTATERVRAAGLDVVYYGSISDSVKEFRLHGQIIVRRGDTTGVGRILATLGPIEVVSTPDSGREVDISVVLGHDFALPSKP